MKMLSVEDIERTIIQHQHQQNQHQTAAAADTATIPPPAPVPAQPPPPVKARDHFTPAKEVKSMQPPIPMISSPVAAPPLRVPPALLTPPLSLLGARNAGPAALFPPGPSQDAEQREPSSAWFAAVQHASRPTVLDPDQQPGDASGIPAALLVRFPAARVLGGPGPVQMGPPPPLPPRHPGPAPGGPPPFLMQRSPTPLPTNQFNQRLVQEIQQNHPLLAFNRQLAAASTLSVCGNGVNKAAPLVALPRAGFMKQQHHFQQQQQQRSE
ncbi:basic proline-rich protein-like [Anopheles merus]|uniref:basic proline-rich protein-like n=1 Tax=Anopheles merus TaxID=30066 RepID=UPI001BE493D4|nr:basic proline-rich protein-like [Anopheles merus]